ncbi:IS4 family transposase [Salinispira pacifica]|uniref:Mobile element protein n=1 Tax=Salinispira pacifica TaxID=1307761 RepID=V5WH67_9SPIO|nr:IS4 family transposase [Salinispira pacifica]AHC14501.1 Mobile element protein [Salinispira pacifica]
MKKYSTVLGTLNSVISRYDFKKIVDLHDGDKGIRTLSTDLLLKTMTYAQVSQAFSLNEVIATMHSQHAKLYHAGMAPVKKSTVADALAKRSSDIFKDLFYQLLGQAGTMHTPNHRFRNPLQIIDATTIDLCLSRYDWAQFRTTKGAIKLHASYNSDSALPNYVQLSTGKLHETNTLLDFPRKKGDIMVFDRGYNNYKSFHKLQLDDVTFVTRLKKNARVRTTLVYHKNPDGPVLEDAWMKFTQDSAEANYPDLIRVVTYKDPEHGKVYRFLTNNFDLPAHEIADIYKERWQVELFFKWIKQNLKIKTFFGTSKNAVWSQIWIALIVYVLIWMMKVLHGIESTFQKIMQVLKLTILDRRDISELFHPPPPSPISSNLWLFEGAGN